ncbi:MAG TPA: DUF1844 domain-containing protein [Candidatus Omnitrophica bacterium]|nr:MAG: hypothetical protein A2Z92_05900 [Omnitrophica WOR_2 bacterium GWA2_63_20]OGX16361.1 MAG: hypothetical protein A2105_05460 [Omnitrophica WOR_2 bacterium GWF2_63_9]OGX31158.1 MAG: hypothetical protein A3E56_04015 [Omnitrophica WOR_2 bacterium RIFCSPHIGHO2_12_FULL_64_13]OGX36649.1 MAG: hypothetical protein A3B73_02655 [Omnitrophica WOR_2 bacterium RIFCSPHIGHO2_02_FULL_63_39]OGX45048.1 MAG: hypothetical protein A3I71_04035 [Omnitrophica WOR_2 bacterium RIFCSPLOWO2_02_FULL_63_16]OGX50016.1
MTDASDKRVDESWKEQVELEKHQPDKPSVPGQASVGPPAREAPRGTESGVPEARFDLFLSGLAMEALIALGDAPHPQTRKSAMNLPQARYLVDLLGVLEEKTRGNLSVDEERLLKETLYQLRMRYMAKAG